MLPLTDLFAEYAKIFAAFVLFLLLAHFISQNKKHIGTLPPVLPYMIPLLGSFPAFARDPIQMVLDGYKKVWCIYSLVCAVNDSN
jgi:hypothetical protein